jgi:hypothetical protein
VRERKEKKRDRWKKERKKEEKGKKERVKKERKKEREMKKKENVCMCEYHSANARQHNETAKLKVENSAQTTFWLVSR